jgi:DNA-binding HxlR family transcriptional regulator
VTAEEDVPKKLARRFNCPTEFALEVLGGKWKTVILCYLKYQSLRYAELRKLLPTLSDKVLTERLHELVSSGLVAKHRAQSGQGAVQYSLTGKGRTLRALLEELYAWGIANAAAFGVKIDEPLKRMGYRG